MTSGPDRGEDRRTSSADGGIDALLDRLFVAEGDYHVVLARLCLEHPELESELRRRVARLEAHGVLGHASGAPRIPVPGEQLGPWSLREVIGRGAMGTVFRARRANGGGPDVALKLPHAGLSDRGRERFAREALLLRDLDHPNVCGLLDVGEDGGTPWIAMEWIDGRSLADQIDEDRRELTDDARRVADAARWTAQLAHGLAQAHARGIVHRDIKPANVLLRGGREPVLIDFGLARREELTRLTASRLPVGTPAYMAPEQVRGEVAGPPADVYALGAVLYELLTLRPPFESTSREDLFRRILTDDVESPRVRNRTVPAPLAHVVGKCLEKDPRRRYPDAATLAEDLDRFLHGRAVRARPVGPLRLAARRLRRHPVRALVGAVVALAVALALALTRSARLESEALAGSMLSSLYTRRYGEEEALAVAARAFDALPNLRTRSQFYRLWVDARVDSRSRTDSEGWLHAAVSPDGRTLAIAAAPAQPAPYRWLGGEVGGFERALVVSGGRVAWSPDGDRLAVLADQRTVRVVTPGPEWSPREYQLPAGIPSRSFARPARSVAFGPDDGAVWIGTEGGTVHRLVDGGTETAEVFEPDDDVLVVRTDGDAVVAASRSGRVAVLDVTGEVRARPLGAAQLERAGIEAGPADRIALDLEARSLAVARFIDRRRRADACQLEIWRLPDRGAPTTAEARLVAGPLDLDDRTADLAVTGDATAAAVTRRGALVRLGAAGADHLPLGVGAAFSVSRHGDRLVVTTMDGEVLVVGADGDEVARVSVHRDAVPMVLPGDGPETVWALSRDGALAGIDLRGRHGPAVRPSGNDVYAARWLSEDRFLTATSPHRYATWSRGGDLLAEAVHGDRPARHRLAVAPENGRVAVAAERLRVAGIVPIPSAIQWLEAESLDVVATNPGVAPRWRGLAFAAGGEELFAVDGIRLVRLRLDARGAGWDLRELVREEVRFAFELVAAGAGRVVTTGTDGHVEVRDADGRELARTTFEVRPTALAIADDVVLVGFQDGSARALALTDLAPRGDLARHPRRVTALAVSVAGRIAVGSSGGLVAVHVDRAEEPWLEFDASAGVEDLDWTPSGTALLVATGDRRVQVLPDLTDAALRRHARRP